MTYQGPSYLKKGRARHMWAIKRLQSQGRKVNVANIASLLGITVDSVSEFMRRNPQLVSRFNVILRKKKDLFAERFLEYTEAATHLRKEGKSVCFYSVAILLGLEPARLYDHYRDHPSEMRSIGLFPKYKSLENWRNRNRNTEEQRLEAAE
jgi:hypothetical protein